MNYNTIPNQMENKSQRLALITQVIQNKQISSQEELLKELISQNCLITQATLSRDLKLLKVVKMPDVNGVYKYSLPGSLNNLKAFPVSVTGHSLDGFISMEFSDNIAVIRTIPAFAQPISQAIDDAGLPEIAGTIAGNDTVFMAIRSGFTSRNVIQSFIHFFPEITDKLQ
jgi:transcriptional regulator of arginine metabolism